MEINKIEEYATHALELMMAFDVDKVLNFNFIVCENDLNFEDNDEEKFMASIVYFNKGHKWSFITAIRANCRFIGKQELIRTLNSLYKDC